MCLPVCGCTASAVHTIVQFTTHLLLTRECIFKWELDLNILSAKVQTLGSDVVDSFYVLDNEGKKIVDKTHAEEIREAVRHAI